jgi:hypothetical protein
LISVPPHAVSMSPMMGGVRFCSSAMSVSVCAKNLCTMQAILVIGA